MNELCDSIPVNFIKLTEQENKGITKLAQSSNLCLEYYALTYNQILT